MIKKILMFISFCASFDALSMLNRSLKPTRMPNVVQGSQSVWTKKQDESFESVLLAMQGDLLEELDDLIAKKVNLNIQDQFGRTSLMKTIRDINFKKLDAVLKSENFNINQQDNAGFTVLDFLEQEIKNSPKNLQLQEKHKLLLEHGAEKYPDVVKEYQEFWNFCSERNNNGSIQKWIDKQKDGFNLDALDVFDQSALSGACHARNKKIVLDLLRAGIKLTVNPVFKFICHTSNFDDTEMIQMLLTSRAISQDCKNDVFISLAQKDMMHMPEENRKKIHLVIKEMLEQGVNPDIMNLFTDNKTMLYHAIDKHDIALVELLLEHGADPFIEFLTWDNLLKERIEDAREQNTMMVWLQALNSTIGASVYPTDQRIANSIK